MRREMAGRDEPIINIVAHPLSVSSIPSFWRFSICILQRVQNVECKWEAKPPISWLPQTTATSATRTSRAGRFIWYDKNINENTTYILQVHRRELILDLHTSIVASSLQPLDAGSVGGSSGLCSFGLGRTEVRRRLDTQSLCEVSEPD